jgi:hypothetical protein
MHGDPGAAGQHLHRGGRHAQLDLLANQPVRHAVVVAIEFDVVVDVHADALEAGDGHTGRRQRPKLGALQRQEGRVAAAGQLLEGTAVQLGQQLADGGVQLAQAEEAPVAQPRQDPALDDLHADFHLRLVARMTGARRQHRHAVVGGELLDQPAGDGVVAVGPGDQCPGLVGHDQPGHAADELQRVDDGADPVGGRLGGGGAGIGVVRCTQHRHEDLRAADLAGGGVHDGHGLAGVVHEQLLAGDVGLAHRALQPGGPGAVLHAVGGVLVGQSVVALVLLPQQLQRDARAAQFLVDVGEVGFEVA